MELKDLKVEYRKDPVGLDVLKPRFSWIIVSEEQNVSQKAYRIVVKNENDAATVWDTGIRESDSSVLIEYDGMELKPCSLYQVCVEAWDNKDNRASLTGSFETGLMEAANFCAEWITHEFPEKETACPVFVKEFEVGKSIARARVYATALGVYEIKINGEKLGDAFFAPGWTNYKKRLQYQTYIADDLLKEKNKLEITVGNGWYKGFLGFRCTPDHYGDRVALLAQIHITHTDGTSSIIKTDDSWKVTTGAIRSSEIYMGETIDSCFKNNGIKNAVCVSFDKSILVGQESEFVRIIEKISAKEFIITPKGERVIDFGQNLTGFVQMKVKGIAGQKIVIRHAEALDKDGNFYPETLRQAISHDIYICNGEEQTFLPHFTFHGFRYICVEGLEDIIPENYTACVLHTQMEETGGFICSNELVNRLQSNIKWGQRGNFLDIPTDCPQRDERLGWTGDAQVFAATAAYNYNIALFFRKWLRDLASEQTDSYGVPHVVPNILGDQSAAAGWGDAAAIVPWVLYQSYGDVRILEEQYDSMKNWIEYITSCCGDNGLWQTGFQYGDWLALDKEEDMTERTGATDVYLIANAFYAYSTDIACKTAGILNKPDDAKKYENLYKNIKKAFNEEYITATGRLVSETQTACVLALYFNLAEEKHRERIINTLKAVIAKRNNHLCTGFIGTPYLCHVLTEINHHDIAGSIFLKEDYPSWLYPVKKGATTIWERWNSILPNGDFDTSGMNSLNHYAYGSIGDWMYRRLAGINQLEPGYKRILIKPRFIKGITRVKAAFKCMYGDIKSAWSCKDGCIKVDLSIPANTTAVVYLPEKEEPMELGSGSYHFEYDTETDLEIKRFTRESTLQEILAEPLAVEIFNRHVPEMLSNPMIKYAYQMTINQLSAYVKEETAQLYDLVLNSLNEEERTS